MRDLSSIQESNPYAPCKCGVLLNNWTARKVYIFYLSITYLFLDLLGVHCCAFSTWGKWELFFEVHRLLIEVASLVVDIVSRRTGFSSCKRGL